MPTATATAELVTPIRHASRKLVRELGFMRQTLAGTDLSPSQCHCLIEIGDFGINTTKGLGEALTLGEGEVRATIAALERAGHVYSDDASTITTTSSAGEVFRLTQRGQETLSSINRFAKDKVQKALDATPPESGSVIAQALLQYAAALETCRDHPASMLPSAKEATGSSSNKPRRTFQIRTGYRPGILARILQMHMDFYWPAFRFGCDFETELATGYSDLLNRLGNPVNELWSAVETLPDGTEKVLGTIIIDGEDMGDPGRLAQLRAFVVDEDARGMGVGKALLARAVEFVDGLGFEDTRLWTLAKLGAARHMYEAFGFVVVFDADKMKWGHVERTMMYSRRRPGIVDNASSEST